MHPDRCCPAVAQGHGLLHGEEAVLAAVLNTSLSIVRKWEGSEKHPSGPSLKLFSLLDRKALEAVL